VTARAAFRRRGKERPREREYPAVATSTQGSTSGPEFVPVANRVLGIDPGLSVTGYAVVDPSPRGPYVVEAGIIRPRGAKTLGARLRVLHQGVLEILDAFPPSALALEQVHSHVRHPRTAIIMAHARGVIVLAAAERDVTVVGYAAARIKKTLTGSGKAPKLQMQHAIKTELGLDRLPEPHDVADACAVALCHFQISRNQRGLMR
jgi:crossover junction endodeoxyribonuclease RuvC